MEILVVDDSRTNLLVTEKYLREIEGIKNIQLCYEPEKAADILKQEIVDILLLDIVMPKVSGFDILQAIRSDARFDDMPIIMFTSLLDDDSFKKCFELGATDYINKPIRPVEFRARITAAIDARRKSLYLKELLRERTEQNNELKEANTKLVETRSYLIQSEKMAAIGQLAAGVAHEINNPMGFVSSNIETLDKYFSRMSEYIAASYSAQQTYLTCDDTAYKKNSDDLQELYKKLKLPVVMKEIEGLVQETIDGIHRISTIIVSLRNFARTVTDDEKDYCVLVDLVGRAMLIGRNEVKYAADIFVNVPDSITLFCNEVQVSQVLINIIVNAAQAIKAQHKSSKGRIDISAEQTKDGIIIEIADDGPGIRPEDIGKIFDPFFTTKDVGEGTGLGLSVSYDIIVNKHGGKIDVNSVLEQGTKFTIWFPSTT